MKKLEFIMGMPIIVEVVGEDNFGEVFDYFREIDEKFSPYKQNSEVTRINNEELIVDNASEEMQKILELSEETKKETNGYFDIYRNGYMDPSGIVKGWAIYNASKILDEMGYENYYINAGGDIQTSGLNSKRKKWVVGVRNPFNIHENVKVVYLSGEGIATSGTYEKGNHIYDPHKKLDSSYRKNFLLRGPKTAASQKFFDDTREIVSLTVIGSNVYEADRFATPAFAMGKDGIGFIERQKGLEGYVISRDGIATMTSGFEKFTHA